MNPAFYWNYATRSLRRGGQRTLLAIFCVAVGVLAIVALQLVGNMVNASITGNVVANNGGDLNISASVAPLHQSDLAYFDSLVQNGTLTTYTASVTAQANAQANGLTSTADLVAVDPQQYPLAGMPAFNSPSGGSLGSIVTGDSVVLTQDIATALHANIGDMLHVAARDGRAADVIVGGIVATGGLFQRDQIVMDIATYTALPAPSSAPVGYTTVYANVPGHTDANATSAAQQIRSHFALTTVQTAQQALQNQQKNIQTIRYFLQIVGLLALLIGGVGIVNTMQVALRRRRTEIAMLKTTGYQRRDLYALFGVETGLLGLIGGILGAAAGVGVAMVVRGIVQGAFNIALPNQIDPLTVLAGVAVGFVTALVFGLMPIVQASQVRPQAVLRELPEGGQGAGSLFTTLALALLLTVLFAGLALSIVQNVAVTLGVVLGTGAFLLVLAVIFAGLVWVISKMPVLESYRWWYVVLVGLATVASVALLRVQPGFGIIFLALSLLGFVVVLLPRTIKTNLNMALRNIGRQRARTVTTLVALFIGIFAIGLVLVLGQDIEGEFSLATSSNTAVNTVILANSSNDAAVQQQVQGLPGINRDDQNTFTNVTPALINGTPLQQIVQGATSQGNTVNDIVAFISGVQGYDLAGGQTINTTDIQASQGRLLNASDAGTLNVIVSNRAAGAPLSLKLGDTLTLQSQVNKQIATVTIVGFYSAAPTVPLFGGILSDNSLATTLSAGHPQYVIGLHIDGAHSAADVAALRAALPNAEIITLADLVAQIDSLLNNLILVLEAIASLALLAGVIIIANTVTLAMLERRRELGILKSFGHTSRTILGEVLIENGIVGFVGGLLAMILAAVTAGLLGKLTFGISFTIAPTLVLSVVLGAATICMVVAALVAWGAVRVRPLEVLRYE
jgi:putative ABC transport system permease protein